MTVLTEDDYATGCRECDSCKVKADLIHKREIATQMGLPSVVSMMQMFINHITKLHPCAERTIQ